jgi:hypothetical protein
MTTLPDSNVRPARPATAGSARRAGRSALARLLLSPLHHLLAYVAKLDRRIFVLLVVSPMSACIIPAGPEFQDPPGVRNSPPFLLSVSPPEGSRVVDPTPEFSVTPSDLNAGDDLWVRWITEYPPNVIGSTNANPPTPIPHSADGSPLRSPSNFKPNCNDIDRRLSTHQVMAAISDSAFVGSDGLGDLLTTTSDTPPILVVWTWQKSCPLQ